MNIHANLLLFLFCQNEDILENLLQVNVVALPPFHSAFNESNLNTLKRGLELSYHDVLDPILKFMHTYYMSESE